MNRITFLRILLLFCVFFISSFSIEREVANDKIINYTIRYVNAQQEYTENCMLELDTEVQFLTKKGNLSIKVKDIKIHDFENIVNSWNFENTRYKASSLVALQQLPHLTFFFDANLTLTDIGGVEKNSKIYHFYKEKIKNVITAAFPIIDGYPSHPFILNKSLLRKKKMHKEEGFYDTNIEVEQKDKKTILNCYYKIDKGRGDYSKNYVKIQLDNKQKIALYRGGIEEKDQTKVHAFEIQKKDEESQISSTFFLDYMRYIATLKVYQNDEMNGMFSSKMFENLLIKVENKELKEVENYIDNILNEAYVLQSTSVYFSYSEICYQSSTLRDPIFSSISNMKNQNGITLKPIEKEENELIYYRELGEHVAEDLFNPLIIDNNNVITFDAKIYYPTSIKTKEYRRGEECSDSLLHFLKDGLSYDLFPSKDKITTPFRFEFRDKDGKKVFPNFKNRYKGITSYGDLLASFVRNEIRYIPREIYFQYENLESVKINYFDEYYIIKRTGVSTKPKINHN